MPSKYGVFDHIENIPGTPTSRLFKDRLDLIRMADQAGFFGYHFAEHHGSDLCMAPSQELFIAAQALETGEISSEDSRFFDFPTMPMATRPYQENIPFWYPGSPQIAGRYGMSLMWPGKINPEAYEQYLAAWHEHERGDIRLEGPNGRPQVGYSMLLAIAQSEDEALDIARRGMEVDRAQSCSSPRSCHSSSLRPRRRPSRWTALPSERPSASSGAACP